jgi:hypothetical protein
MECGYIEPLFSYFLLLLQYYNDVKYLYIDGFAFFPFMHHLNMYSV